MVVDDEDSPFFVPIVLLGSFNLFKTTVGSIFAEVSFLENAVKKLHKMLHILCINNI